MSEKRKKLIQINTVCDTSTGRIMRDIQQEAIRQGYEAISYVGRRRTYCDMPCKKIGSFIEFWIHVIITLLFDMHGYGSYFATRRLVRQLKKENPDIIHLHNLHGYYLNLPVFFRYLRYEFQGKLYWTFHDCWPFTGHCAYFTMANCQKWKTGCYNCPNKMQYPISICKDASRWNYIKKREMFLECRNLKIIVPSRWMKELVQTSFFGNQNIFHISNGIDLDEFHYSRSEEIEKKYNLHNEKKIVLGVANVWDKRKGIEDFISLSKIIPENYCIVLVGVSYRQRKTLPANIIGIKKTKNKKELVALYSRADFFVNPSREESFSLVTVEAFACGTPVIVLNSSAVKELVGEDNGIVLNEHTAKDYLEAIQVLEEKKISRQRVCACAKKYNKYKCIEKIIQLYDI